MSKVFQDSQTFTVRCNCGETCTVTLDEEIETKEIEADAFIRAEEAHGWGDHGYCPGCQAEIDADVAEVEAADVARKERRVA